MSALSLPTAHPAPFVHHVVSDTMEPTYRARTHALFCIPVAGFQGEGVYLIGGQELYRCAKRNGRVHAWRDNARYPEYEVDAETFGGSDLALVVADVTIRNHDAMRSIL